MPTNEADLKRGFYFDENVSYLCNNHYFLSSFSAKPISQAASIKAAMDNGMSLFNELERRNVFRAGLAYLVSAWIFAQVADLVLNSLKAPDWVMQVLLLFLGLGFIGVVVFSWAYELTPDGIRRDTDVSPDDSISDHPLACLTIRF